MKKLLSQSMLECIEIDHENGMEMLETCEKWVKQVDVPDTDCFQTLGDFAEFRIINSAAELVPLNPMRFVQPTGSRLNWKMVEFSHGEKLSKGDHDLITKAVKWAQWNLIFMNDYYSWEKEYRASKHQVAGRLVNVVAFFMRTEGLSLEAAKEKTRNSILEYEQRFFHEKAQLYKAHPSLPFHVRKHIETVGL